MNTADRLFTEEQKQQIVRATRRAEARATGEIVVLVADRSGRHHDVEVVSALVLNAIVSLLVVQYVLQGSFWHWLAVAAALFPFCFLFFTYVQKVTLSLVPRRHIETAIRDSAMREFNEHGMHKTKGQTGVLFYISLIERRVFVYADKGIYEKLDQQMLQRYANDVAAGIKAGRTCEALVQAITEIGEVLAAHFPGTPDNVNELPEDIQSDSHQ